MADYDQSLKGKTWVVVKRRPGDTALNLRREADPSIKNVIMEIPLGHIVETTGKVDQAYDKDTWYEVMVMYRKPSAEKPLEGQEAPVEESRTGWVNSNHLRELPGATPRADYTKIESPAAVQPAPAALPAALKPVTPAKINWEMTPAQLAQYARTHPEEMRLLNLVNEFRAIYGLHEWKLDRSLLNVAEKQAAYMAQTGDFSGKDANEADWFTRISNEIPKSQSDEYRSKGKPSPEGVMREWLNRPDSFRKLLLHPNFTAVAVAKKSGTYGDFWALDMALREGETPPKLRDTGLTPQEQLNQEKQFIERLDTILKSRRGSLPANTHLAENAAALHSAP